MPYNSRNQQRLQAKISRTAGQRILLLIPPAQSSSTDTPLSISQADSSVDLTQCQKVPVYATFVWNSGQFTYGEGGETLMKVGTVKIAYDYSPYVVKAYAVQLADGEILLKRTQALDESQTTYTLSVESQVATQE